MGKGDATPQGQQLRPQLAQADPRFPTSCSPLREEKEVQNWPEGHLLGADNRLYAGRDY